MGNTNTVPQRRESSDAMLVFDGGRLVPFGVYKKRDQDYSSKIVKQVSFYFGSNVAS